MPIYYTKRGTPIYTPPLTAAEKIERDLVMGPVNAAPISVPSLALRTKPSLRAKAARADEAEQAVATDEGAASRE